MMKNEKHHKEKKWTIKRILLWIVGSLFVFICATAVYLYYNLNHLATNALIKSFNSNIISNVYELKFNDLNVNLLQGSIKVNNVELQPREKPLAEYPYINSSFRLKTRKMILENVQLMTLLKSNELKLNKIVIAEPEIELKLNGTNYILLPFADTTGLADKRETENKKSLKSFQYLCKFND